MSIVAFASLKGGTGKSTSCTNLSYAITSKSNIKILVLDFDIQSGTTHIFSSRFPKFKAGITDVLKNKKKMNDVIHAYSKKLHFVPMKDDFFYMSCEDFSSPLEKAISEIRKNYNYIFLDLPPSIYPASGIPLCLCDDIVIPINCSDGLGVLGLQGLLKIVKHLDISPNIHIIKTIFDRTKTSREVNQFLNEEYPDNVIPSKIRKSALISQSCTLGKTIFEHRPNSIGAQDYKKMAKDFLNTIKE